jgi:hypothetical protein
MDNGEKRKTGPAVAHVFKFTGSNNVSFNHFFLIAAKH